MEGYKMKVKVNEDACIGCGACVAICEKVFAFNDEGVSVVKVDKVEKEEEETVQEAINSCPTGAISKE